MTRPPPRWPAVVGVLHPAPRPAYPRRRPPRLHRHRPVGWARRRLGLIGNGGHAALGHSIGAGVVWRSPLGPLTLDLAAPSLGPPRILFGFGRAF